MTRLAWLDSTVGTDPDFIIEPFEPVASTVRSLSILGRRVELGATGLPDRSQLLHSRARRMARRPQPILARPLELECRR